MGMGWWWRWSTDRMDLLQLIADKVKQSPDKSMAVRFRKMLSDVIALSLIMDEDNDQ